MSPQKKSSGKKPKVEESDENEPTHSESSEEEAEEKI